MGCCKHLFPGKDILVSQTSCSWFITDENYLDRLKTIPINGVKKGVYADMATQYALHTSRGKQTDLMKYYNRGKLGAYSYGVPEVFYSNGLTTDEVSSSVQGWLNDNVSIDLPDQLLVSDRVDVPTDLEWIVFLSNELSYKNDNNSIYLTRYLFVDMDGLTVRVGSILTDNELKFFVVHEDNSTETVIFDSMQDTDDYLEVTTTDGNIIKFPQKQTGLHYVFGVQYNDDYRTYIIIDYIEGEHPEWEYIINEINTTLTTMPVVPIKLDEKYNEDGWVSENVSPNYKDHDHNVMEYKFDDPDRTHDIRQQLDKIGISLDGITTQMIEANKFGQREIIDGTDPEIVKKINRYMNVFSLEQKYGYANLNDEQKEIIDQYSVYLEPLSDYQDKVDALDKTQSIFVSYALNPFSLNRETKKAMFLTWKKLYSLNDNDDGSERRIKITEGVFNKVIRWRNIRHFTGPGDELGCTSIEYDMDFREVVLVEGDPEQEIDDITAEFLFYTKQAMDDDGNKVLIEEFGLGSVDFHTVITSDGMNRGNTYDLTEENKGKIAIPLFYDVFIDMDNNFEKEILEQKAKYLEVYVSEVQHLYWYQTKLFGKILSIAIDLYALAGIIASVGTATPAIEIAKQIIKELLIRELIKKVSTLVLKELIRNISDEKIVAILYGVYLYETGVMLDNPINAINLLTGSYSAYAQKRMIDLSEEQEAELEKYAKLEKEMEEMQLELQTIIVGAAYESPEKFYNRTTTLPLSLNLTVDKDTFSVYD